MDSSVIIIARNIRELRDSLGLSQKSFSELGNMSPSTLVNIESEQKSFRLRTLERILEITEIPFEDLVKQGFKPPRSFREKLIKKFIKDPEISVILNREPTIQYGIKYKMLEAGLLEVPLEIGDIKKELLNVGFDYKGNSIHVALKRMPDLIKIQKHPTKKGTFLYSKK